MTVPEWIYDAIFYQIFPDRFANGNTQNDPPNLQEWGAKPTIWGFQGGDLDGVIQKLDYLLDLGVNAIYLNPIFQASSNHRYNISNYYKIDPKIGDMGTFSEFLDQAHARGFRVVLDGVFNHCGRGFFAFNDVLENGKHSAYKDWFHFSKIPPKAYEINKAHDYAAWWDLPSLPKFNTDTPAVRAYILGIARHWIELGIDGWRLDVPNEIDDDAFWAEFRQVVKDANPDAYIVGEIWTVEPRWVSPNHFDGLMNYPLRDALLEYFIERKISTEQFNLQLSNIVNAYDDSHLRAHLLTIGSHDTVRLRTACKQDAKFQRLLHLFQFCFPGVPTIFYGDEIGIEGGEDPDCRKAFPWEPESWDKETRDFLKTLTGLRNKLPALRYGGYRALPIHSTFSFGYSRTHGDDTIILLVNGSDQTIQVTVSPEESGWGEGSVLVDHLTARSFHMGESGFSIELGSREGAVLGVSSR